VVKHLGAVSLIGFLIHLRLEFIEVGHGVLIESDGLPHDSGLSQWELLDGELIFIIIFLLGVIGVVLWSIKVSRSEVHPIGTVDSEFPSGSGIAAFLDSSNNEGVFTLAQLSLERKSSVLWQGRLDLFHHLLIHDSESTISEVGWQLEIVDQLVVLDVELNNNEESNVLVHLGVAKFLVADLSHGVDELTVAISFLGFLGHLLEEDVHVLNWVLFESVGLDNDLSFVFSGLHCLGEHVEVLGSDIHPLAVADLEGPSGSSITALLRSEEFEDVVAFGKLGGEVELGRFTSLPDVRQVFLDHLSV
jgi:hypothetical protein